MKKQMITAIIGLAIFSAICGAMGFKAASSIGKQYVYIRGMDGSVIPKLKKLFINYPDGKAEEIALDGNLAENTSKMNAEFNKLSREGYELIGTTSNHDQGIQYSTFVFAK